MDIVVRGSADVEVRAEIGRLHGQVRLDGPDRQDAVRRVSGLAQQVGAELVRLQEADAVGKLVIKPLTTTSWVRSDRRSGTVHSASVSFVAEFVDFEQLAAFTATYGSMPEVRLTYVGWDLHPETRRSLEADCLTRAVHQARDRAAAIASAAGAGEVSYVRVADPGLVDQMDRGLRREGRAYAMTVGADVPTIEVHPDDIEVSVELEAAFRAE